MVAELLALMHIADVYLYHGRADGAYAVVQRHAGVRVCPGIKHYAVCRESHLVHLVYQFALDIALIVVNIEFRIFCLELFQIVAERTAAIDARLTLAKQIEVGAVDYLYFHNFVYFLGVKELRFLF